MRTNHEFLWQAVSNKLSKDTIQTCLFAKWSFKCRPNTDSTKKHSLTTLNIAKKSASKR